MRILKPLLSMLNVSSLKFRKKNKETSTVKDLISNPDNYKLEAYVDNGEIIVKIKKREEVES